jgi:hypothetical protein
VGEAAPPAPAATAASVAAAAATMPISDSLVAATARLSGLIPPEGPSRASRRPSVAGPPRGASESAAPALPAPPAVAAEASGSGSGLPWGVVRLRSRRDSVESDAGTLGSLVSEAVSAGLRAAGAGAGAGAGRPPTSGHSAAPAHAAARGAPRETFGGVISAPPTPPDAREADAAVVAGWARVASRSGSPAAAGRAAPASHASSSSAVPAHTAAPVPFAPFAVPLGDANLD